MAWNRDLTRVAVTSQDDVSTTLLWDYEKQRVIGTFHSFVHGQPCDVCLAWSPDGQRILQVTSNSSQNNVICWKVEGQQTIYTANNQSISDAWRMRWSPDGRHAAVIGVSTFVVFSSDNGQELFAQQLNNEAPTAIAWSPTGDRLALLVGNTISKAITLRIWDVATGSLIAHLDQASVQYDSFDDLAALIWIPGGNELVVAASKRLWLTSADDDGIAVPLGTFTDDNLYYILDMAPDGTRLAVSDASRIAIWNVRERRQEQELSRGRSPSFIEAMSWVSPSQIAIIDGSFNRVVLTR